MRALLLSIVLAPALATAAPPMIIDDGLVIDATSRWTADGSRIVTEARVRTPNGELVTVSQLGGTVDGLTMRTFPGPEILAPGMRVALAASEAMDLSQRMHRVVDSVKVLWMPPEFVRTGPTKAGKYLYWESGCVYVTVDADGTKAIAGDGEFAVIDASIATWNDGVRSCSYLDIVKDPTARVEVGKDRVNVIKFRDATWCRPALGDDPPRCHSPSAAGLTTAVFVDDSDSDRDGAIVDADIELNGVDFAISVNDQTLGDAGCKADLANTLTHELGHMLGLEHPCRAAADPQRVDGDGNPVPACATTTDPEIIEATMYNFQDCGETKKASLSMDEITAVCTIYPTAEDPNSCEHVSDGAGCCSAADGSPAFPGVLVGLLTFGLLVARRKNSASR
jgi:hypothetical protein